MKWYKIRDGEKEKPSLFLKGDKKYSVYLYNAFDKKYICFFLSSESLLGFIERTHPEDITFLEEYEIVFNHIPLVKKIYDSLSDYKMSKDEDWNRELEKFKSYIKGIIT